MRLILAILTFSLMCDLSTQLFGQEKKLKLSLEYMAATSKISEGGIRNQNKYGQSITLHAEYPVAQDARLRLGIGILEVGEKVLAEPNPDFRFIEETFTHSYIYVPVGLKLLSGNYFIIPEVGLGFNRSNRVDTYQITFEEKVEDEEIIEFSNDIILTEGLFNHITIPISLTVGIFIPIKQDIGASISARIFTSTNSIVKDISRKNRYSGAGLVIGFHF